MDINFTGFKNIGAISSVADNYLRWGNNKIVKNSGNFVETLGLNVNLTDDFNGKDLSQFYKDAKKSALKNYINSVHKDFLHIIFLKNNNKKNAGKILINNSSLDLNDDNLSVLSFIGKLIKRISETPKEKLIVNKDYLDSEDVQNALIPNINIKYFIIALYKEFMKRNNYHNNTITESLAQKSYDVFISEAHSYDMVHYISKRMYNLLQNTMIDYFNL